MSEFSRPLRGYRLVSTLRGDTLQAVALRELGNAARWVDLANINNLLPPYLTDDPALSSARVILTGGVISVPSLTLASQNAATNDPDAIYELDLGLVDGELTVNENGDFNIFDGLANLRQALVHRVITERGELMFHPEYGCLVRTLIGVVNGPTAAVLAAKYVQSTLQADPRIKQVLDCTAVVTGNTISVVANVLPITGTSTKIEAII